MQLKDDYMKFEEMLGPSPEQVDLALELLGDARTSLMMAFRYMDSALWNMDFEPTLVHRPLATEGLRLHFNAKHVLARYQESSTELARDLLHCVLHCVFRQPFDRDHENAEAWTLACDVIVESVAIDMCAERLPSPQDEEALKQLAWLREKVSTLTPNKLYALFDSVPVGLAENPHTGMSRKLYHQLRAAFVRDTSELWPVWSHDEQTPPAGGMNGDAEDIPDAQQTSETEATTAPTSENDQDSTPSQPGEEQDEQSEAEQRWEEIAQNIQVDLETLSAGSGNSALMSSLKVANRSTTNYTEFLKSFRTLGEDMVINDDEFDYIFYTYGLSRYGNMPLIEPLEYREDYRVREFAIALDTSGSCSGELIKRFVSRTYEILSEGAHFGERINIHLIQADNRVQSDTKIENLQQLEEYRDEFWVRGYGGTDFRPVFEYVDNLVDQGEFENLRGLIYFTDGIGTFPDYPPSYDVAFVFVDELGQSRRVPPWAMKATIDEQGLALTRSRA